MSNKLRKNGFLCKAKNQILNNAVVFRLRFRSEINKLPLKYVQIMEEEIVKNLSKRKE